MCAGKAFDTVVADLAAAFDVDEETLQDDVDTIDEWLPRLDITRDVGGISLLAEVRSNRQELHQLADQAREPDEWVEERKGALYLFKSTVCRKGRLSTEVIVFLGHGNMLVHMAKLATEAVGN